MSYFTSSFSKELQARTGEISLYLHSTDNTSQLVTRAYTKASIRDQHTSIDTHTHYTDDDAK